MSRVIALLFAVAACGLGRQPNYYSIKPDGSRSDVYSRVNEYASYERDGLGKQAKVAAAYEDAQHAPPPAREVEIYNSSLPPGVRATGGAIEIEPGTPLEGVGRFEIGYWMASAPLETEIGDDLKRLAAVTNSDVVVVEVDRVEHGNPHVNHAIGILLRKKAAAVPPASGSGSVTAAKQAVKPHVTAQLVYEANARGCLSAGEFADEVSARLGYSPWVTKSQMTVHTSIVESGGTYRATIRAASGDAKQLAAPSCRAVTDAAISAILVRFDS